MRILHECVVKPTTDPMVFPITGKPYLVEGSSILYAICAKHVNAPFAGTYPAQ
jgi:hypothetical protein